ncbi:MAG: hypothetical protein ABIS50_01485 [Luteolibacter sp.]|uniref:hypothetical protein n=1 Tax=Luteolibacter sp. TaxID=1962973 RepID=UPI0032673330
MNTTFFGLCSVLLLASAIGIPIYYVIFRRRFWFPAFVSWLLLVGSQQFAVLSSTHGLSPDGSISTDTTTVGLTLFTGWLLSIPFCGILLLIRILLCRFGLLPTKVDERDAVVVKGKSQQCDQVEMSNRR